MPDLSPEDLVRDIYRQTRELHEEIRPQLQGKAFGFRILYGPPVVSAPILFLGYQPGGSIEVPEQHVIWPSYSDYACARWSLADRLQAVFPKKFLLRSTGLNLNFFRSPRERIWRSVDRATRMRAEEFCAVRAEKIVKALKPQKIVVIGLRTFNSLSQGSDALTVKGRTLAIQGSVWGIPACGSIHLTGAWISGSDRGRIEDYLRSFSDGPSSSP